MPTTAIIVDDNPDVLDTTASFLERNGLEILGLDATGESALQHLRDYRPDIAVIDVFVPGIWGLGLLETIRRERLPTRTILVTGHQREAWLVQALELRVEGYLIKPHIPELIVAVQEVMAGRRFLDPWALESVLADYLRLKTAEKTKGLLTPREWDVFNGRSQGKSVKEIAIENNISPKTVEKHVTNLRKKVGAARPNRADVAPLILTKG